MRAHVGDKLLAGGGGSVGLIVSVLGTDGLPPYVVKWQRGGHIAMVLPDQYARIIPASPRSWPAAGDPSLEPPGSASAAGGPAADDGGGSADDVAG
jgi:Domain of unknown function (DUF1918)